jgi:phytoene desaturase
MQKYMDIPDFKNRIEYQKIYAVNNFVKDYNAFKGSALGLAHTLNQTAIFRPNNVNKKVKNLFYVGAGTNPGIGMPICLISAKLAYKRIENITDPAPLKGI